MGCLAAYFTHVQSCDVTRVQSATQWTASVQTSHQDVMQYRGRLFTGRHVTSRQDVTCRSYRGQGASRHVTSRQDVTGAAVDKEAVTSRHVTSRQGVTAPPWTRRPSRHVPSGHHRRRRGQGGCHVTSRQDITSRHVTSRRQAPDHALIADFTRRQARRHPQWCTTQGGLQNTDEARELVEPDCTPTGTSMWYHLWSTGCSRSGSAPRPCQVHGILTYW